MDQTSASRSELSYKQIFKTWWPLALSWMMMSLESTMLSAVIARLPEARLNLAASGGIMQPIRQVFNAPVIMLLSASVALVRDWATYKKLYRFMMILSGSMTALLALVAFTPLYDVLAGDILGAPVELHQLARWGLMISVPVGWGVAYRRLHQGILIRNGLSNAVMTGTFIRLSGYALILVIGYWVHTIPGTVVEAAALMTGIWGEAIYTGIRVRPVLRFVVKLAPAVEPLSWRTFFAFYIPLVATSLLNMIWSPFSSAAISRMPRPIDSLAVLPVVNALISLFRSFGLALNEVTVTLLDRAQASARLGRFALYVMIGTTALFCLVVLTPLSDLWFDDMTGLMPALSELAKTAVLLAIPLPALSVIRSWSQGILLFGRKTRAISEAMVLSLVALLAVLWGGVSWGLVPGVYIGVVGLMAGNIAQAVWLWNRSRGVLAAIDASPQIPKIATPI
jgi:hypothetical protein